MKRILAVIAGAFLVAACAGSTPAEQPIPDLTEIYVAVVQTFEAEVAAEVGPPLTNTPLPSSTPRPPSDTAVPFTETPVSSLDDLWARNYMGSGESGGVTIEIARVLVGYKWTMPNFNWSEMDEYIEGWADTDLVGELIFKITNNSDIAIDMRPLWGTVQIGSELIDLNDYNVWLEFGDDLNGDIFPGVTKIGGIWFGIKRSVPSEITEIIFRADEPRNSDTISRVGPKYEIVVDVSQHAFEVMPDELK